MNLIAKVDAQVCSSYGGVDHKPNECLMYVVEVEQVNTFGMYNRIYPSISNTFNQQWQNHPNLSWRNKQSSQPNVQWRPNAHTSSSLAPQNNVPQPRNPIKDQIQALIDLQKKYFEDQDRIN